MSRPIEDKAFLLWEELPDTKSGKIKVFIFLTGTWRKIKKSFAKNFVKGQILNLSCFAAQIASFLSI
jgi:DTW domain-containing protein YfiP